MGPAVFGGGQEGLRDELQKIFHERPAAEWVELAAQHDVPLGPAPRTITEAAADPHVATRGILYRQKFPGVGAFTYVGEAGRVAGQPYTVRRPAPGHGEHTDEILAELGDGADEIAGLRA